MKKENIDFLNANRHHWIAWEKAQIVNQLDYGVRQRLLDIIHEEWSPVYNANLWCSPCVIDMLKYAYTQFDKWIAEQNVKQS